jgi:hypothetical protein
MNIKHVLFSIDNPEDLRVLTSKFNLKAKDSIRVDILTSNLDVSFKANNIRTDYILPFYFLTDQPNELQLTIFAVSEQPKRNGEKYKRGKYHFILYSTIEYKDGKTLFKESSIVIDAKSINKWFLDGYKSYLDKTRPVFKRYGFVPPPPPLPPSSL